MCAPGPVICLSSRSDIWEMIATGLMRAELVVPLPAPLLGLVCLGEMPLAKPQVLRPKPYRHSKKRFSHTPNINANPCGMSLQTPKS